MGKSLLKDDDMSWKEWGLHKGGSITVIVATVIGIAILFVCMFTVDWGRCHAIESEKDVYAKLGLLRYNYKINYKDARPSRSVTKTWYGETETMRSYTEMGKYTFGLLWIPIGMAPLVVICFVVVLTGLLHLNVSRFFLYTGLLLFSVMGALINTIAAFWFFSTPGRNDLILDIGEEKVRCGAIIPMSTSFIFAHIVGASFLLIGIIMFAISLKKCFKSCIKGVKERRSKNSGVILTRYYKDIKKKEQKKGHEMDTKRSSVVIV